jgi:hypothetical protein
VVVLLLPQSQLGEGLLLLLLLLLLVVLAVRCCCLALLMWQQLVLQWYRSWKSCRWGKEAEYKC